MTSNDTKSKKVMAVVPAFNEGKTIGSIVSLLFSFVDEVIVVNDASTDDTEHEAKNAGATVVSHTINQKYDAALDNGVRTAYEMGADIIITFDADGEHNAEDIPSIITPLLEDTADMVVGDRGSAKRERVFALYTQLRYGIPDPVCGFKAYKREIYERIGHFDTLKSTGTQLMIEGLHSGGRLAVVPIQSKPREDTSRFYHIKIIGHYRIMRSLAHIVLRTHFKRSPRENVITMAR